MPHDLMTRIPDPSRGRAWTIDERGRVREGEGAGGSVASGWVDVPGGVGRIDVIDDRCADVCGRALEALEARYPGVRWLSERGAG